jgi:ABC-type multidrug transport system ATPase subunit
MIRIRNLVKKYGEIAAVNDVSLDVPAGEIFAFLGPNGAGKTTTIKMLTTLLTPTSGTIEIDGLNPASRSTEVRRRFGIVFQDPSLDQELTATENIHLHGVLYGVPRTVRYDRTEQLLKPRALDIVARLDPLSYGVDGIRGALIGAPHFSLGIDVAVLGAFVAVLLVVGSYLFSRIQV